MPARNIPGIQRGPDFDREINEASTIEKIAKTAKLDRPPEANDPIVSAAVDAAHELANSIGRKVDVQYEPKTGIIVMSVYSADGEELIRRIPPEDAIRMAQNHKTDRSQFFDEVI